MRQHENEALMRAVLCVRHGEPKDLVIGKVPVPIPAQGEVLLAVEAVGLGFVDTLFLRGEYQIRLPLPFIPGGEVAGRIIAVGAGAPPELLGQRVMALVSSGGLAEQVAVPSVACVPIPEAMSSAAAAGAIISYCTALYGLSDCGGLRSDETVLVLGAAGTVGLAAIAVAKAMGAKVVAAASSPEKLRVCIEGGADVAIDYSQADWRQQAQAAAGDGGIDVVYDPVGGTYTETALRCLSPGGRLLVVGFASGNVPRIPLSLPLLKRCSIVGVDFGGYHRAHPQGAAPMLVRLANLVSAGAIRPRPTSVHSLADTPTILQQFLNRSSVGKPVIVISDGEHHG